MSSTLDAVSADCPGETGKLCCPILNKEHRSHYQPHNCSHILMVIEFLQTLLYNAGLTNTAIDREVVMLRRFI